MQKLIMFGIIFAVALGMTFVFAGGVHAEGSFPAESGGWMKNNPHGDELPASPEPAEEAEENSPVFDDSDEIPSGIILL